MKTLLALALILLLPVPASSQQAAQRQPLFELDEQVWVLFYDLPSRRFRTIRDAVVRRDFATARRDLEVSHGFLLAELQRADPALTAPLTEVVTKLEQIAATIDSPDTTIGDLDAVFARAHWLLSQHYLTLARAARDNADHKFAGDYLWATAHHLERTVLWSDARLTSRQVDSLDAIRALAERLRSSDRPERVYRDKPIAAAQTTLRQIGEYLDRKVWVDATR